jgi:hypothetical protein
MATRNKIIEASMAKVDDRDEDIPEWARPADQTPEATPESIVGDPPTRTPAMDNLLAWLVLEAGLGDGNNMTALESIVRETLSADNPADVLRQKMPMSGSRFVQVPMLLEDFRISESDFEDGSGLPFYANMYVQVGNPPEPRVINVSSVKILAQLKRLRELDQWPQVVQIIEAAKAKKGQSAPLALAPVEEA